ncbi:MAG TPA: phospholipase D-like domain-containing protein [Pyrinomonadaceae bacterium]|nr:phospholipase D-like domain-containing protein [Pyrinomonadaceae bacterium]
MDSNTFLVIAIIAIIAQSLVLFLALFEPGLDYKITQTAACAPDSAEYLRILEALTDAQVTRRSTIEVFTNGENYYEAELAAIRRAEHNVNIEAYIFQKGRVADEFVEALTERARAGVRVNLVLDAIGSFASWDSYFKDLRAAGGRICWYHPFRWYTLPRINNRTHRELFIVDGRVAFVGGAGVADHWRHPVKDHPRWRDSMFRVEGDAVANLQATFAENWLEASGEILSSTEYFPLCEAAHSTPSLVVNSSPSAGRSTRARILFQMLLASAQKSILITTPYFLPDRSARAEMVRAIRERGVEIRIVVPGQKSDHALTRNSSRRLYGDLLEAGAKIYEYAPTMMHAKTLVVDGIWSVVGSTNFDNRSFGLNDEVNLAACDEKLAARITEDFERDCAESAPVSYEEWRRRPIFERVHELFGMLLERQQ